MKYRRRRYHGGIDNRERSLFQSGPSRTPPARSSGDSFLPSPSPLLSTFAFPSFLPPPPRPPSFPRATERRGPGLSLLQIGLVVLRVHRDNSGLALCFLRRERTLSRGEPLRGEEATGNGGHIVRRGEPSRAAPSCGPRALCFALFEIPRSGARQPPRGDARVFTVLRNLCFVERAHAPMRNFCTDAASSVLEAATSIFFVTALLTVSRIHEFAAGSENFFAEFGYSGFEGGSLLFLTSVRALYWDLLLLFYDAWK